MEQLSRTCNEEAGCYYRLRISEEECTNRYRGSLFLQIIFGELELVFIMPPILTMMPKSCTLSNRFGDRE